MSTNYHKNIHFYLIDFYRQGNNAFRSLPLINDTTSPIEALITCHLESDRRYRRNYNISSSSPPSPGAKIIAFEHPQDHQKTVLIIRCGCKSQTYAIQMLGRQIQLDYTCKWVPNSSPALCHHHQFEFCRIRVLSYTLPIVWVPVP